MTHQHRNDDWAQPIKKNDPKFYDAVSDSDHYSLTRMVCFAILLLALGLVALWM